MNLSHEDLVSLNELQGIVEICVCVAGGWLERGGIELVRGDHVHTMKEGVLLSLIECRLQGLGFTH